MKREPRFEADYASTRSIKTFVTGPEGAVTSATTSSQHCNKGDVIFPDVVVDSISCEREKYGFPITPYKPRVLHSPDPDLNVVAQSMDTRHGGDAGSANGDRDAHRRMWGAIAMKDTASQQRCLPTGCVEHVECRGRLHRYLWIRALVIYARLETQYMDGWMDYVHLQKPDAQTQHWINVRDDSSKTIITDVRYE